MLAWSDTATGIIVLGAVVVVALVLNRRLDAKLGKVEVTLGSIDRSVNHRPDGASTMSQDVTAMRAQIENTILPAIALIPELAKRVGVLEHPPKPEE